MKTKKNLPVYFEAFGSIGVTVSFFSKREKKLISMMLAECPEEMRLAVLRNPEHFKTRNSGYELKDGKYVISEPIKV